MYKKKISSLLAAVIVAGMDRKHACLCKCTGNDR